MQQTLLWNAQVARLERRLCHVGSSDDRQLSTKARIFARSALSLYGHPAPQALNPEAQVLPERLRGGSCAM